jgi:hypothetical protein
VWRVAPDRYALPARLLPTPVFVCVRDRHPAVREFRDGCVGSVEQNIGYVSQATGTDYFGFRETHSRSGMAGSAVRWLTKFRTKFPF